MAVTARQQPDFRTISDFRKRHLSALGGLFTQVLQLYQKAGLVRLGHVALDGTKIRAAEAAVEAEAQDDARDTKRKADHQTDRPRRGRPAKNPPGPPPPVCSAISPIRTAAS